MVDVENALIDLEKQLDESTFLQVLEEQGRIMSTPPVLEPLLKVHCQSRDI